MTKKQKSGRDPGFGSPLPACALLVAATVGLASAPASAQQSPYVIGSASPQVYVNTQLLNSLGPSGYGAGGYGYGAGYPAYGYQAPLPYGQPYQAPVAAAPVPGQPYVVTRPGTLLFPPAANPRSQVVAQAPGAAAAPLPPQAPASRVVVPTLQPTPALTSPVDLPRPPQLAARQAAPAPAQTAPAAIEPPSLPAAEPTAPPPPSPEPPAPSVQAPPPPALDDDRTAAEAEVPLIPPPALDEAPPAPPAPALAEAPPPEPQIAALSEPTPPAPPAPAPDASEPLAPPPPALPPAEAEAPPEPPAPEPPAAEIPPPELPAPEPPAPEAPAQASMTGTAPEPPAPEAPPAPSTADAPTSTQTAAVPPAGETPAELGEAGQRLGFAVGSADLDESAQQVLSALAETLKADGNARVQLLAYASSADNSASRARRLSLSRALAVRAYLIDQGVRSTRMDVRALGDKSEGGPPDRVDILPARR